MLIKRNPLIVTAIVIDWLLFAGCTPQAAMPVAIPSATPAEIPALAATEPPTPIPTRLPTSIPTELPTLAPAGLPRGPGAEWHLVVLSDSQGWGLGAAYASQIEKDVGVKVILGDFAIGSLKSHEVLEVLQTGKSYNSQLEKLPAALKEAEVVVMLPFDPSESIDTGTGLSTNACHDSNSPPTSCTPEAFKQYTATLKTIWTKIIELRSGQPTILRALDYYNPFVGSWKEYHIFDACTTCWEYISASARQAAEAFHISFFSRYDAFNGSKHDEDPGQKGYILPDGMHPTDLANKYTAELLVKLGYEPVSQP